MENCEIHRDKTAPTSYGEAYGCGRMHESCLEDCPRYEVTADVPVNICFVPAHTCQLSVNNTIIMMSYFSFLLQVSIQ